MPTLIVKRAQMLNVKQVLKLSFAAGLIAADLVAYPDLAIDQFVVAMAAMADMATEVAMEVATVDVDVGAQLTIVE